MNKQISPKSVLLWRIWLTALAVPLFFICGILMQFSLLWGAVLFLVLSVFYLFSTLVYLPRRYRSFTYQTSPARIELKKGVFFENQLQLEFNSIIYTKCTQTILQRSFHVCTLKLHPIGRAATLPQLPLTDAEQLLNTIEETCHEI